MLNIYVCGPTVYSDVHIGNIKPIITFDLFSRAHTYIGNKIKLVHNITDIDNKIIDAANKEGISETELTNKYIKNYLDVLKTYNIKTPSSMPKVTDNIEGIISFIESLIKSNHAYATNSGVYFDITSIKQYPLLSNHNVDQNLIANPDKKTAGDFALWKKTTIGLKYSSPWGEGRPGWHTECAYLIDKEFSGKPLDIHGGGVDLLFPHHENENAQFIAKNDQGIAKEFIHTGLFNFSGTKMSKSIGNVILAKDFEQEYGPNVLRFIIFSSSLTAPVNLTDYIISNAKLQVDKIKSVYLKASKNKHKDIDTMKVKYFMNKIIHWEFADALKLLWEYVKEFNTSENQGTGNVIISILDNMGFTFKTRTISDEDQALINEWENLRVEKRYEEADKIRKILQEKRLL